MSYIGNSPTQGAITGGNIVDGSIESIDLATLTNIDINSGSIDGTIIGASSAAAGTFTSLDVNGTITADGLVVDTGSSFSFTGTFGNGDANKLVFINDDGAGRNQIDSTSSGGAKKLDLATGGLKRVRLDDNGDVSFYEDTGSDVKMLWDASAESLGIGGTPSTILDVIGEAPTLTLRDSRVGGTWSAGTALGKLDFYTSDGTGIGAHSIASIGVVAGGTSTASPDGELVFATGPYNVASVERMRLDSNGNVGIGETDPNERLHINGTLKVAINSVAEADGYHATIQSQYGDNPLKILSCGKRVLEMGGFTAANTLKLYTGDTERARIDSSGSLLVGATSSFSFGASDVRGIELSSVGNLIASANNTQPLYLKRYGSTGYIASFFYSTSQVGSISVTASATSYNTSSDERLKENIQDTTHTVDINDIQVREFDWKVDGSHQRYGFIAQELETVYPEAVHIPEDADEMKSVDYSKLVPLLVKEIQTLKTRIETLENTGA